MLHTCGTRAPRFSCGVASLGYLSPVAFEEAPGKETAVSRTAKDVGRDGRAALLAAADEEELAVGGEAADLVGQEEAAGGLAGLLGAGLLAVRKEPAACGRDPRPRLPRWPTRPSWPTRKAFCLWSGMKLKLDENLPIELLDDLRQAGHEGDSVQGEGIAGAPDGVVLARAREEARVLLTLEEVLVAVARGDLTPEQGSLSILRNGPSPTPAACWGRIRRRP
jgi:hypothetical protein